MNDKSERIYPKRVLLVISANADFKGGVELLENSLIRLMSKNNITFLSVLRTELTAKALPGDLVFFQEEGRLSRHYRKMINILLERGCYIAEKNVFALASPFRPSHPNYFLIFMSQDGMNRFVLRECLQYRKFEGRLLIVPNLLFYPRNSEYDLKRGEILSSQRRRIRIIRVGRPDLRKYTNFEIEFSKKLALQMPSVAIELTRVGVPIDFTNLTDIPTNMKVNDLGYVSDLNDLYSEADVYLQYSRIGETFGHTFFEAYNFGLAIIGCFDLNYDTAPIEYLNSFAHFVSPDTALSDPLQMLNEALSKQKVFRNLTFDFERENSDLLSGKIFDLERTRPKLFEAIRYLYETSNLLKSTKKYFVFYVIMEMMSTHYFRFVIWVKSNLGSRNA